MSYAEIAAAYDSFAEEYDEWVGEHVSAKRAKAAVLARVRALAPRGGRLLDVGCGTGSEAVALARAGYDVTAIDLSRRMLDLAATKAARATARVRLLEGAAGRPEPAWGRDFDVVYSAYGVLNLEPDPPRALEALGRLVRPGGHLIVGTLNPIVLFEHVLWPIALRTKGYRKAASRTVELRLGHGRSERARCHLPRNQDLQSQGLRLVEEIGIHILAPPPSEDLARRFPRFVRLVNRIERKIEGRPPFARLGYFSLLTFRREA